MALALCLLVITAEKVSGATFVGTGTGPIPDSPGSECGVFGEALNVSFDVVGVPPVSSQANELVDLQVSVALTHSWVGDLEAVLIAPGGEQQVLFALAGGGPLSCGDDSDLGGLYTFSDSAFRLWWDEAAARAWNEVLAPGGYLASDSGGAYTRTMTSAFRQIGEANGTWTLRIRDQAPGDTGTVSSASLSMEVKRVFRLNEIVVDPVGDDENCEYVEIIGPPSAPLAGWVLASFEGDSESNPGTVAFAINFSSETLGSNGLLVVTAADLNGACGLRDWNSPPTTLVRDARLDGGGLGGGSTSWLLINSPTTPIVTGMDWDPNDEGDLVFLFNSQIHDAVGWSDGGGSDLVYGGAILPATAGGTNDMASRFPLTLTRSSTGAWYHGRMSGTANSLGYEPTHVSANFPPQGALTPGTMNAPNCGEVIVSNQVIGTMRVLQACRTLTVGPSVTIGAEFGVSLFAGAGVAIGDGFEVLPTGPLTVGVCGQDLCSTRAEGLESTCHPCVEVVCGIKAKCCSEEWSSACVDLVGSQCGLICP